MHRVGIIGSGETGRLHIERIRRISELEIAGIFDFSHMNKKYPRKEQLPYFHSIDELIEHSDIVDIAGRHIPHFDTASMALRKSRHVFIDRPLIGNLNDVHKLVDLAFEADVKVQIGHVERYNPAFTLVREYIRQPHYIEAQRLLPLNKNTSHTHVILDMMIHDIDIVLHLVDSGIKRIKASSHSLGGNEPDMVNAHIEFDNGCIANLSASKLASKENARMQIYEDNHSFILDLTNAKVEQIIKDSPDGSIKRKAIQVDKRNFDPLQSGLESFKKAINDNTTPYVSLMDGSNALEVACMIREKLPYW